AGNLLTYNRGRYYYTPSLQASRLREEERQLHVRALLQVLLQVCKRTQNREERRAADRIEVIWPVTLILEDGTAHRALTRDISVSGIRFLSNRSLLGQKLIARLSLGEREEHAFSVRILWTCEVADGLYENGGSVLEVIRTK
ncbi:MAG: PilZ domain-containing protein, partial [Gemmatales bacterium]|nr:PilZ domain-containing protein [Gemmatales bacterium]